MIPTLRPVWHAQAPAPTIYERLGGLVTIDVAVDQFYDRVVGDPELAPFFERVDLRRQRAHQKAFLTMALGSPGLEPVGCTVVRVVASRSTAGIPLGALAVLLAPAGPPDEGVAASAQVRAGSSPSPPAGRPCWWWTTPNGSTRRRRRHEPVDA